MSETTNMRVVSFAQDLIYDVTRGKVLNPERVDLYVLLSNLTCSDLFCFVDSKAASLICHRQNESLFSKRFSSLFANTRTCNLRPQCLLSNNIIKNPGLRQCLTKDSVSSLKRVAKRLESSYVFYITKHANKKLQGVFIK
jgi:hypothetical protein